MWSQAPVEQLWNALQQRFSAVGQESSYELKLVKRTRDINRETPQGYLDEISYLCRLAFPRSSDYDLEMSIKKYFVLGHPTQYQNHLNASVNRETGTLAQLVQACRQYEELDTFRLSISARRPGVKAIYPEGSDWDSQQSVSSYPVTEASVVCVDPYSYMEYEEGLEYVEPKTEDSVDHQIDLVAATAYAITGRGRYNPRGQPRGGVRSSFRRPMICAYCKKMGHIFRYCRKLRSDYPDGVFPDKVARLIMQELMRTGNQQFERRENVPVEHGRGAQQPTVKAIGPVPPDSNSGGGPAMDNSGNA